MKERKDSLVQRYIQYSKKITLFGMIQWCVLALFALGIALLGVFRSGMLDEFSMGITKTVVVWSATVAFVSVSSYEMNSAVEKVVKQNVLTSITEEMGVGKQEETSLPMDGNG